VAGGSSNGNGVAGFSNGHNASGVDGENTAGGWGVAGRTFGIGEGRAEVELDADFIAVLGIEDGEYHVFLAPEGDTHGLYVDSRSTRSFIVREQQAGASNTTFSYRVAVKNRHRQPERLVMFEESDGLMKRCPGPSQLTNDRTDFSTTA
jgi:hypothetical protein